MFPIKPLLLWPFLCLSTLLYAQVHYILSITDSVTSRLRVTIEPDTPLATPVSFVMARSVPGNYGIVKYDMFVENLVATGTDGKVRPLIKSSYGAPRWRWTTADYYILADAQTFIGPAFRVKEFRGLVPLYVADYTEGGEEYLDDYGWQETTSMAILKDYFGQLPFMKYTVLFRNAIPRPDDEPGNFGMEHLQSSTFFGDTSQVRTGVMGMPTGRMCWKFRP